MKEEQSVKRQKRAAERLRISRRHGVWLLSVAAGLIVAGIGAAYVAQHTNRFLPRSTVGGVDVSEKTLEEARATLATATARFTESGATLKHEGKEQSVSLVGVGVDYESAVNRLWDRQRGSSIIDRVWALITAPFTGSSQVVAISLDERVARENYLSQFETPHREADIAISGASVSVVAGESGRRVSTRQLIDSYAAAFPERPVVGLVLETFEPSLTPAQLEPIRAQVETILAKPWEVRLGEEVRVTLDTQTLASLIGTRVELNEAGSATGRSLQLKRDEVDRLVAGWVSQVNRSPVNARLSVQSGSVVVIAEGTEGRTLDTDTTKQALLEALQASTPRYSVRVPLSVTQPEVRSDTLQTLGLTQRIGVATTDFSGSPQNRAFNIRLGQRNLDRALIAPGAVYSTIEKLGPIDESAGFLAELVIKNNRTIPEAGGGLCQVSTTLFRAVLAAGMPIVERQNHSYRVSYYEREVGPGLDATIYSPKPDFRWRNDLSSHIYVQSSVDKETITFELYGTSDGRTSNISSPQILEETPAPESIYTQTDQLFVGEQRQIERARSGMKTVVQYTVVRDGSQLLSQTFRSNYRPWAAQFLVGTKPRPGDAPVPAPTPTPESSPTITPAP